MVYDSHTSSYMMEQPFRESEQRSAQLSALRCGIMPAGTPPLALTAGADRLRLSAAASPSELDSESTEPKRLSQTSDLRDGVYVRAGFVGAPSGTASGGATAVAGS
eukprot:TRINITY_DN12166_c0_g1_i1.p2 TRINITY_DN12166_c0_g1~~TRINITY_DN12166_c0_g1_i1.p2  ORF type:complete len:106 (+),score=11.44 TRINITY_DN12166_c0_g1_i1:220-537(+)